MKKEKTVTDSHESGVRNDCELTKKMDEEHGVKGEEHDSQWREIHKMKSLSLAWRAWTFEMHCTLGHPKCLTGDTPHGDDCLDTLVKPEMLMFQSRNEEQCSLRCRWFHFLVGQQPLLGSFIFLQNKKCLFGTKSKHTHPRQCCFCFIGCDCQ